MNDAKTIKYYTALSDVSWLAIDTMLHYLITPQYKSVADFVKIAIQNEVTSYQETKIIPQYQGCIANLTVRCLRLPPETINAMRNIVVGTKNDYRKISNFLDIACRNELDRFQKTLKPRQLEFLIRHLAL